MDGYLLVLALIALPILGNYVGGALAEVLPVSRRTLSLALHAAAGIVLAVVGLELMPEALEADPAWVPILAFTAGALFFLALDKGVDRLQDMTASRSGTQVTEESDDENSNPLTIYAGTSLDLFSDGVMIGTGALLDPGLGLLLALGQTPADLPEGFATIATLRSAKVARAKRLLFTAALAVPILLGATIGHFALRNASELVTLSVLALTGGALLSVVIEEIVPEAHRGRDSKLATVFLVGGFALFAAIATYVG
jgi:ZIP family zinc transporter